MGKKLTTEEFILKARQVHGNKYDYSKVNYINYFTEIRIICPKHGEFKQKPTNHIHGHGCQKCGGNIPLKFTINEIKNKIINCKSRTEFRKEFPGLYAYCLNNNIINDVCSHIPRIGNLFKRCIYSYEFTLFNQRYVYVGLTCNLDRRHNDHKTNSNSAVYNFCHINKISLPQPRQITDYINKDEAALSETEILNDYIKRGFIPLNRAKCGGLGGKFLKNYSYKECVNIANKFKNRTRWQKGDHSSYLFAQHMNWLDKIKPLIIQRHITKEEAIKISKNFNRKVDLERYDNSLYQKILKCGWSTDCFSHMTTTFEYFTIEDIKNELKKYNSITEFRKKNPKMLFWLRRRKIKIETFATNDQIKNSDRRKSIIRIEINNGNIKLYKSISDAVKEGFSKQSIQFCLKGEMLSHPRMKYGWVYETEYTPSVYQNIIQKIEQNKFNNKNRLKGNKSPLYGKRLSDKTKHKLSILNGHRVIQLHPETFKPIKIWDSVSQAECFFEKKRSNKIHNVLKNQNRKAYNYRWIYEKDYVNTEQIINNNLTLSRGKSIKQINPINNECIRIWPSARYAEITLGGKASGNIHQVLKGKNKIAYGYKWEYFKN